MNYRLNVNPLQNYDTHNSGLQEGAGPKICCQAGTQSLSSSIQIWAGRAASLKTQWESRFVSCCWGRWIWESLTKAAIR